jgi:two-component system, response regulator PdtaR
MEPVESLRTEAEDRRDVVLIVEDEFLIRWPAAEYLRDSGYRVIEAGSAQEAIVVLSSGTHLDVVFSDVNLSDGLTGHDLACRIAQSHPGIPVLLTSGDSPSSFRPQVDVPFIAKPYVLAEAEQRIKELVERARLRAR